MKKVKNVQRQMHTDTCNMNKKQKENIIIIEKLVKLSHDGTENSFI